MERQRIRFEVKPEKPEHDEQSTRKPLPNARQERADTERKKKSTILFAVTTPVRLASSCLFVSFLLKILAIRLGAINRDKPVSTVQFGGSVLASFVEFVLTVLLFKVGVRTRRVRRRVEIIVVRLVESLVNLIQDHVRMNLIVQVGQSFSLQILGR